jgi:chromatin assembly factor 1 subunit A
LTSALEVNQALFFQPFQVPENSKIAKVFREPTSSSEQLWASIDSQDAVSIKSIIASCKRKFSKRCNFDRKYKLLKFHTEYRPGYWGTFSRSSAVISGRKPFAEDSDLFDYSFDSDDEWEDDDPNADVLSDNDEDDEEEEDDSQDGSLRKDGLVEDGWLMPEDQDNFSALSVSTFFLLIRD